MQKSNSKLFLESVISCVNGEILNEFRGTSETVSCVLNNNSTV